jgi:hypothetical protein
MSSVAAAPVRPLERVALMWRQLAQRGGWFAVGVGSLGALAFVIVSPAVGDVWAALARRSAALHGVGLTYWFSWFGGGATPGNYSVITPFLSALIGATTLGAIATAAAAPLTYRLTRGFPHGIAATWVATIVCGLSLWNGRIPFAVGISFSALAFIAVREQRRSLAVIATLLTVLASPVSGVFLVLGLVGVALYVHLHRAVSLYAIGAAGVSLLSLAIAFGSPGPEPFNARQAWSAAGALVAFLIARPPKAVTAVILFSLVACPFLLWIPNGMGSNFNRFVWVYLPVAVVATTRTKLPRAAVAVSVAVIAASIGTAQDLAVASHPNSSQAYYQPLARELAGIGSLSDYRLEVVPDGTHVAAYALLDYAMLARGYETQADQALNPVFGAHRPLDATTYKLWLDDNAVGYVAVSGRPLSANSEYKLVAAGLPYLDRIWSDAAWTLYHVRQPVPIVAPPARLVQASQAKIEIDVPQSGTVPIRVRWSRFLAADPPVRGVKAPITKDADGWSTLTAPVSGHYVLHG